eukprot:TRINITY_DN4025_c1_g1_i1.p1 TRINITY_DN4025_c1_g1~~TRINITY_DN4025_c1_g1_i1.p1  ORF type:complete len:245 (-),score=22.65 TRINITY_DN4025_c1_g1_i1:77-811(-)
MPMPYTPPYAPMPQPMPMPYTPPYTPMPMPIPMPYTPPYTPMPMPIPMPYTPMPQPMPMPMPMPTPVPSCDLSCSAQQADMEAVACNHTEMSIQVCDTYSTCYEKQVRAWRSMYNETCVGPNSTLETLRYELYIVLKIECLAKALNQPDSTRNAEIQACSARTMSSFNLDAANIAKCSQAEAPWQTSEYTPCLQMQDVTNYEFCSGTSAFAAEYYKDVQRPVFPRDCESECCLRPPTPHKRPNV